MKKTLIAALALSALLFAGNAVLAHCGKCGTPADGSKKACTSGEKAAMCKHGETRMANFKAVQADLANWDKQIGDAAFQSGVTEHAKALVEAREECMKECAKGMKADKPCCAGAERAAAGFKSLQAALPRMEGSMGDASFQREVRASLQGVVEGHEACAKSCSAKAGATEARCAKGCKKACCSKKAAADA